MACVRSHDMMATSEVCFCANRPGEVFADGKHRTGITMATAVDSVDIEKTGRANSEPSDNLPTNHDRQTSPPSSKLLAFERTLVKYNLETRGIQRVLEDEKQPSTLLSYIQIFILWVSVNLVVNNVTLGMLGPAVYELSFTDSSLCASLGAFVGSIPVAWVATFGPLSGNRTMAFGRYAFGWYPSQLIVLLNIIFFLGYSL